MRHRPGYLPPLGGHHDNQRRGQPWTAQSSKTSASPARLGNFGDQIPGASRDRAHQFAGHPTDTDRGRRPDRPAARPSDLVQSRTVTPQTLRTTLLWFSVAVAVRRRKCVGDRCHRRPGRSWPRHVRGGRRGDRHLFRCHCGSAGAQRHTAGRSGRLGALAAGSIARTEPRTTAGPAGGNGVRANESHLRRRQLRSRCSTCDGRIRIGVRLDTRSHDRTAPRRGCRQVASS